LRRYAEKPYQRNVSGARDQRLLNAAANVLEPPGSTKRIDQQRQRSDDSVAERVEASRRITAQYAHCAQSPDYGARSVTARFESRTPSTELAPWATNSPGNVRVDLLGPPTPPAAGHER